MKIILTCLALLALLATEQSSESPKIKTKLTNIKESYAFIGSLPHSDWSKIIPVPDPPIPPVVRETRRDRMARSTSSTRDQRSKESDETGIEGIIRLYFPENPEVAIAVARAESGLNPTVVNYLGCVGIFQIRALKGRPSIQELQNPETNIKYARSLYDWAGGSFKKDWEVCTKGMVKCY